MGTAKRRLMSALVGGPLLLAVLVEAYIQSFGFYEEHYIIPMVKFGVVTPLRTQDIIFLAAFWPTAVALFYASYRLLKYGLSREPPATL